MSAERTVRKVKPALSPSRQRLIAIIPGSDVFQPSKPFTVDNINQRLVEWLKQSGFATPESFIEFIKSFQSKLN